MILLIDNYDSFSYNLFQLVGAINPDIRVIRNDQYSLRDIEALTPTHLILSPGPGRPGQAGICIDAVRHFAGRLPILGVCLGHQAICEAYGATVSYARTLMHGKQSDVRVNTDCHLFSRLPAMIKAGRYHSLAALENTLPPELVVTAKAEDGEIMAVRHRDHPVFGVQFHPESILTPCGRQILANFLSDDPGSGEYEHGGYAHD